MRIFNVGSEKSVCAYCHVPHRAASELNLFAQTGTHEDKLGLVGAFCYSCHDGTVVPTAIVEAPDGTLGVDALAKSHGLKTGRLSRVTEGLEGEKNLIASGLVPIVKETGTLPARMECTVCHSIHNNTYPPFLAAPMEVLCTKCHSGSDLLGKGRMTKVGDTGQANGAHPVGMPIEWSANERKWPKKNVTEMTFGTIDGKLIVPLRKTEELASISQHWSTGGHMPVSDEVGAAPKVGCATCHSAHSVKPNLLILDAADAESGTDPLCNACHGRDGKKPNPGGTPWYHPAEKESGGDYATSTNPPRLLDVVIPSAWPRGKNSEILCMTCHRAHQAKPGTMGLRDGEDGKKYICETCHLPEEDITPVNSHHYTTLSDKSAFLKGRQLSWNTQKGGPGDLSDGLTCIDCHSKLATDAHNW